MLQGMNDHGQLGIGNVDMSKALFFLGEFMKKDFFQENKLKVLDVSFGSRHTLILTEDRETKRIRVFGSGASEFGQLCKQTSLVSHEFQDLSNLLPEPIKTISAGSYHSLFITASNKLYGCGKNSKGQLGFKSTTEKFEPKPVEIKVGDPQKEEVISAVAGSLYSMALTRVK